MQIFTPDHPQTLSQLARVYGTSTTSVQRWLKNAETKAGQEFPYTRKGSAKYYSPEHVKLITEGHEPSNIPHQDVEPSPPGDFTIEAAPLATLPPQPYQLAHVQLGGLTGFNGALHGGQLLNHTSQLLSRLDQVTDAMAGEVQRLQTEAQQQIQAAQLLQAKVLELEKQREAAREAARATEQAVTIASLFNQQNLEKLGALGLNLGNA